MPAYLKYRQSTGAIIGIRGSSNAETLLTQTPPAGIGFFAVAETHTALRNPTAWRIDAGAIVPKAVITLTPDVITFAADGAIECTITSTGLTGDCLIYVDRQPVTFTLADPVLILTSADPRRIEIRIDDALHWGKPLIVKAI